MKLSLVQQQIRANQQSSLNDSSDKFLNLMMSKRYCEYMEEIDEFKSFNSEYKLYDGNKEWVIDQLKQYLEYCRNNNMPLSGKLADCSFEIDSNNPKMITITGNNDISILVVNGDETYCEYAEVTSKRVYYRQPGKYPVHVELLKTTYVIDNEEINEFLTIKNVRNEEISDEKLEEITKSAAQEYGYEIIESGSLARNDVENIFKMDDIVNDESILNYYTIPGTNILTLDDSYPAGFYESDKDAYYYNSYSESKDKSEDRITILKNSAEFNKKALTVYSRVSEAYKKMPEQKKEVKKMKMIVK